jgi:Xaa-Pro aminopeptidase
VTKTQKEMEKQGLDMLFCFGNEAEPQYCRYYSDYWPNFESGAVLIPAKGAPLLLIGPESMTYATSVSTIKNIRKVLALRESSEPDYPGVPMHTIEEAIKEISGGSNVRNIGIAGSGVITHNVYAALEIAAKNLNGAKIVKADDLVSRIRAIKSQNEIACMKEAYRITTLAMKNVLDGIHIGMTENQVKAIAMKTIFDENAESEAYPFWILTGRGSNQAISRVRNKTIQAGDLVQIQVSARYKGYSATMGRAVVMGKATETQKNLISAALTVQKAILNTAKAGLQAKVISEVHYNTLKELGYEDYILYGPCHGTGLMEGEYPWIESVSDYTLEAGMTFCTCIYLGNDKDEIGLRIEDGFLITEDGTESFSDYRREIIEII